MEPDGAHAPAPSIVHMERAISLATASAERGGGPFGAVIVKAGAVIAEGTNRVTAAPDPTAHAEIVAIRAAAQHLGSHSLSGCELYSSCEPCPMCLAAAHWARLERVWFAADRYQAARAGFDDLALYRQLAGEEEPVLRVERHVALSGRSSLPFERWQANEQRTPY